MICYCKKIVRYSFFNHLKQKIMGRILFIAIIALISFSCNNSGSATELSDTAAAGTDTINSLNAGRNR